VSLGIKGFTPTSLIDWPGKIAAVIFLGGCSFRCHYCYNPEFIDNLDAIGDLEDKEIFDFLEKKKKWLDGVVMLGGEPTIHKNFHKIIGRIKDLGLRIGVHTNGTSPKDLKKIIDDKLVDYIAMDIKAPLDKYKKVVDVEVDVSLIKDSVGLIKKSNIDYEFRITVVPGLVDKEDIKEISEWLSGSKRFFIQQFKPGKVLDPKYSKVQPYKVQDLLAFKKIAKNHFDIVDIRGV